MKKMSGRQEQLQNERSRQLHDCRERRERKRNSLSGVSRSHVTCGGEGLSNGVLQSMNTASAMTPIAIGEKRVPCDMGCTDGEPMNFRSGNGRHNVAMRGAVNSVGVVGITAGGVFKGEHVGGANGDINEQNRGTPARNHFGFSRYAAKMTNAATAAGRKRKTNNPPYDVDNNIPRIEVTNNHQGVYKELLKPPHRLRNNNVKVVSRDLHSPPATTRDVEVYHK